MIESSSSNMDVLVWGTTNQLGLLPTLAPIV
jgi:hypothetical protein